MAGDERRAEAEAVARVLWPEYRVQDAVNLRKASEVIAVLDRLRDARGDDGEKRDIMDVFRSDEAMRAFGVERSPQGEDHVCYVENGRCQYPGCCRRVSSSRDGTVAVEDVLQALVDEARGDDEWVSGHDLLVRVGAIVMDRLAARSATGEQTDHGGSKHERRH